MSVYQRHAWLYRPALIVTGLAVLAAALHPPFNGLDLTAWTLLLATSYATLRDQPKGTP